MIPEAQPLRDRSEIVLGSYSVGRDQPPLSPEETEIVRRFHDLYYTRWAKGRADTINASWFGYLTLKCPLDLWIYQELLVRSRPDIIVETGTWCGGSSLYLAMLCEQLGHGKVITIDLEPKPNLPQHPRLTYVHGSSTDAKIVEKVYATVQSRRAMVILDSDHSAAHVYSELQTYHRLVQPGDYLIVEDTNLNGHPTFPDFGPGPMEALDRFLAENKLFEIDQRCERFLLTLNPRGYLQRKR